MKKFCPLCNSGKKKCISQITRENIGTVQKCRNCGHVFLDLGIEPEKYEEYYDSYYKNDSQRKDYIQDHGDYINRIKKDNLRRLNTCKDYLKPEYKILDFGAGYGLFSYLAKPFVSDVTAADHSNLTKENAAKFGINYISDILQVKNLKTKFDVIFTFHTVEHLIDPVKIIKHLANLLSDRGFLIVEVPNQTDLLVRMSKKYRAFNYTVAHLHYYNKKNLINLFENTGLALVDKKDTQRYGFSNHMKWVLNLKMKDRCAIYQRSLSRSRWADTLFCVFQKH